MAEVAARPRVKPLKAAVKLGASLAVLGVVFAIIGPDAILEAFDKVRLGPWLVGLVGFLGLHFVSAAKWRFFLGLAGAKLPFPSAIRFYGAGLFANLCLPSLVGGDVLRAGLAMSVVEDKEAIALGSVVDRLSDVAALGLLVGIGFVVAPSAMEDLPGAIDGFVVFFVVLGLGVLGLLVLWLFLAKFPRDKLPTKVQAIVERLLVAAGTMAKNAPRAALGLAWCLSLQAGFVLVNVHLGNMMGLELDLRLWFLLWPLAKVAAMVPVSLGGLGVREAAFGALVKPFASASLAVAESLVWQSILIVGGFIAGAWWLFTRGHSR
ncbi:MAG: lysylphosphatidylglycerol synthase transmembrane domain-containing protein [Deltaproteobacteria bacterium]|jgi:hypothetical protein